MGASPVIRRRAAILAADVVGYSRLVAEDEEGTLRTLDAYRRTSGCLVAEHGGRPLLCGFGVLVPALVVGPLDLGRVHNLGLDAHARGGEACGLSEAGGTGSSTFLSRLKMPVSGAASAVEGP